MQVDSSNFLYDKLLNVPQGSGSSKAKSFKSHRDLFEDLSKNLLNKPKSVQVKKIGLLPKFEHLPAFRKKLALLGWGAMWGGFISSIVVSLFKGFKQGFSEPISSWLGLSGLVTLELADFKNGLLSSAFRFTKSLLGKN